MGGILLDVVHVFIFVFHIYCKFHEFILYWTGEAGKIPITKNEDLFTNEYQIEAKGRHP